VRLFAALRERAGSGAVDLDLPDGAAVSDVWPALELGDEPPGILFAVNRAYADRGDHLAAGDEVALIPPVSGGSGTTPSESEAQSRFRLFGEPLSLEAAVAAVRTEDAGAIATFVGTTRRRSRGRDVLHLEYEAYEGMAEDVMEKLADDLKTRHDLCEVSIHHRVGRVDIGEASVVIAVSAPHRADALAACREAIDELKVTVPLWKKEVYQGGEEWIGTEAQYQAQLAKERE
jgi:molybdopterin synthase catalytic subunit/molybdopterin converting factor small subunit